MACARMTTTRSRCSATQTGRAVNNLPRGAPSRTVCDGWQPVGRAPSAQSGRAVNNCREGHPEGQFATDGSPSGERRRRRAADPLTTVARGTQQDTLRRMGLRTDGSGVVMLFVGAERPTRQQLSRGAPSSALCDRWACARMATTRSRCSATQTGRAVTICREGHPEGQFATDDAPIGTMDAAARRTPREHPRTAGATPPPPGLPSVLCRDEVFRHFGGSLSVDEEDRAQASLDTGDRHLPGARSGEGEPEG
jgi:hypothetical protein